MNSLRGKGLAILAIYCAKTMKPAREAGSFQMWNMNQERGTHGVDEDCFMIFSWTHHGMELECQRK